MTDTMLDKPSPVREGGVHNKATDDPPQFDEWRHHQQQAIEKRIDHFKEHAKAIHTKAERTKTKVMWTMIMVVPAAFAGLWAQTTNRHSLAIAFWGAGATLLVAAVCNAVVLGGLLEQRRQTVLEQTAEQDVEGLISTVDGQEMWELAALSKRQMSRFECLAVGQARIAFTASVIAAAAALTVLIIGTAAVIDSASTGVIIASSALTAAGTALTGFISVTFLKTYSLTAQQLGFYYGQPLVNCYFLHAERLMAKLSAYQNPDERRESLLALAKHVMHAADTAQNHVFSLSEPSDRPWAARTGPRSAGLKSSVGGSEPVDGVAERKPTTPSHH